MTGITAATVKRTKSVEATLRLVDAASADYRAWQQDGESKVTGAALATYAAYRAGVVDGDKRLTKVESPVESKSAFVARFGVTPNVFPAWLGYGFAIVELGFKPNRALWLGVSYANVLDAIYADGATMASVQAEIDKRVTPDGKRIVASRTAQPDKGKGKGKGAKDDAEVETVSVALDPFQRCMAAVQLLDKATRKVTDRDAYAQVESALHEILSRETLIRTKQAEQAAKTAKRTAAKKTAAKAA